MTYIPRKALELKTFASVEEMNHHMNLHYLTLQTVLTKSFDTIFHLIKKFACLVAGVCWLKQENLASLADVSIKTVERGVQFLKDHGVVKIYHTKRVNGLNGHSYYVLQPFQGEVDEKIDSVEEGNVGAGEGLGSYEKTSVEDEFIEEKLLNSSKTLESSNKALQNSKKEECNEYARARRVKDEVQSEQGMGPLNREIYESLVQMLVGHKFTDGDAKAITTQVFKKCHAIPSGYVYHAYAKALSKYRQRSGYHKPIYSLVDYFVKLVVDEIEVGVGVKGRGTNANPMGDIHVMSRNKCIDMLGWDEERDRLVNVYV